MSAKGGSFITPAAILVLAWAADLPVQHLEGPMCSGSHMRSRNVCKGGRRVRAQVLMSEDRVKGSLAPHLHSEGRTSRLCPLGSEGRKPTGCHHRSCLTLVSLRSRVTPLLFLGPSFLFQSFSVYNSASTGQCSEATPPQDQLSGIQGFVRPSRTTAQ